MAAAAPCGTASPTTLTRISSTSARATPQPWVQKFRGAQGLDNLYTCSILAVDLTTGQLKWHYQAVPNDNWDYDNVQQLMLLDLTINGRMRKVITQAPKNGFFYVLDRVTGEFLSAEPFVKVSWALRMGKDGRPVVNPAAYYDQEPISVFPTGGGGTTGRRCRTTRTRGWCTSRRPIRASPIRRRQSSGRAPPVTQRPRGRDEDHRAILRPGAGAWCTQRTAGVGSGESETRWNIAGGGGIGGGTSTTAGNLVFQVINDGRFRAISADKGEILYEVRTGRTGMAPPITYEVDGKQYVAFGGGLGRSAPIQRPDRREGRERTLVVRLCAGRHGGAANSAPARCRTRPTLEPFSQWRRGGSKDSPLHVVKERSSAKMR